MWDERRRSARVVLDDGRDLPVADGAVDEAGLVRVVRGQRLSVELTADEHGDQLVSRVRLLG
jgi:cold shock CspA family protein